MGRLGTSFFSYYFGYFGSIFTLLGAQTAGTTIGYATAGTTIGYVTAGRAITAGIGGGTMGTTGTFLGSSTILVEIKVIRLFNVILYLG